MVLPFPDPRGRHVRRAACRSALRSRSWEMRHCMWLEKSPFGLVNRTHENHAEEGVTRDEGQSFDRAVKRSVVAVGADHDAVGDSAHHLG